MSFLRRLLPGTPVIATDDFGPVIRGQWGMVTAVSRANWLSWRPASYACIFLGDVQATASGRQIARHDHGCSRTMLEDPWWFLATRDMARQPRQYAAALRRPHA